MAKNFSGQIYLQTLKLNRINGCNSQNIHPHKCDLQIINLQNSAVYMVKFHTLQIMVYTISEFISSSPSLLHKPRIKTQA